MLSAAQSDGIRCGGEENDEKRVRRRSKSVLILECMRNLVLCYYARVVKGVDLKEFIRQVIHCEHHAQVRTLLVALFSNPAEI